MCVNYLPQVVTWQCTGRVLNLQPRGYKFGTLTLDHQASHTNLPSVSFLKDCVGRRKMVGVMRQRMTDGAMNR